MKMQNNYHQWFAERLTISCFFLLGIGTLIFLSTAFAIGSERVPKKLTAIATQDNDLSLVGNTVDVPEAVQRTVHTIAHKAFENWKRAFQGSGEPSEYFQMKLNDVYGMVVRIKTPLKRDLFIFQEKGLFGAIFYHLILFDPHTNAVTQSPPKINGK